MSIIGEAIVIALGLLILTGSERILAAQVAGITLILGVIVFIGFVIVRMSRRKV